MHQSDYTSSGMSRSEVKQLVPPGGISSTVKNFTKPGNCYINYVVIKNDNNITLLTCR